MADSDGMTFRIMQVMLEEFRDFRSEYHADRRRVWERFEAGEKRMDDIDLSQRGTEINLAGMLQEDRRRNGHIEDLLSFKHSQEAAELAAASMAAGRASQRAKDTATVRSILQRVEKPFFYGAGLLLVGIGARVGAFLIGVPW